MPAILGSMGNVLPVVAVLPEMDSPEDNVLIKATTGSQPFDNQLYLFEAVGTLISLLWRDPSEQLRMLEAVIGPLVRDIDAGLQRPMNGGTDDALQILQIHHLIMSIGSIAKGFPDAPETLSKDAPVWISAFEQASDGIFRALDVMKSQRIVRDAVSSAWAFEGLRCVMLISNVRPGPVCILWHLCGFIIANEQIHPRSRRSHDWTMRSAGNDRVYGISRHVDSQAQGELCNYIAAKRINSRPPHSIFQGGILAVMDELWLHLLERITLVLSLPVTGTDDAILQSEMKKAYVAFISTILSSGVQDFLISERES